MENTVENNQVYRWSADKLYLENYTYAGPNYTIKTKSLREYRPDGPDAVYAVDFDYACLKCGNWHQHNERQKNPIMVATLTAPCGFSALFPLPMLEPE